MSGIREPAATPGKVSFPDRSNRTELGQEKALFSLEGKNFALTQNKILKKGLAHFPLETAPKPRHGKASWRGFHVNVPGIAMNDGEVAINFAKWKRGELEDQPSLDPGFKGLRRKEGQRTFRNPDRDDTGKTKGLPLGEAVEAVQDSAHAQIERLIKTNPRDLRLGKGRRPGKGDQWSSTAGKRGICCSGRNSGKEKKREPVIDI